MGRMMIWLRKIGWHIVLTWHQLVCKLDCGFSSVVTEDGAVAWCKTCDKTWSRP